MLKIPVNSPVVGAREQSLLETCIKSGWISSEGPFVRELEVSMAQRCQRAHAIAVANGSAALDVAVAALQLPAGSEVILPTFTIISCAAAIVRQGLVPVVVDCDPWTWNMAPDQVAAAITPQTSAIMAVHIYGLPVDMAPLFQLAKTHGLRLIEDAAEAIGQTYRGKPCGSFGDISTLSFYPNKLVTTGEGGMLLTDDDGLAQRCRSLRNLCFQKRRFIHEELGWNYRMSNLQAAVGVAQFEALDQHVRRKREIGELYQELLADCPGITLPVPQTDSARNLYWVFGLVIDDEHPLDADVCIAEMAHQGIGCRNFFWPMHQQPVLQDCGLFEDQSCPVAERIARRGLYLPGGLALTDDEIRTVAARFREVVS